MMEHIEWKKRMGELFLRKKMSFTQSKFGEILISCEALKIREHNVFNFFLWNIGRDFV